LLLDAATEHTDYIAGETLALELRMGEAAADGDTTDYSEQTEIEGLPLSLSLRRAGR
jgi:hypothetical protein